MQPTFLPWIGYFDLIDAADKFVFYNDVQFSKQSWQCRNRIKTANGIVWLTVPVKKHLLSAKINEIEINNLKPWTPKFIKTLFHNYRKTAHFAEVYDFIEQVAVNKKYLRLSDFSIDIIKAIVSKIGINTKLTLSSNTNTLEMNREDRLVEICHAMDCNTYLSTKGSSSYIEASNDGGVFSKNHINLLYHNYIHPEYQQSYGKFEPYMSIVDLLFNEGFIRSLGIIRKGRGQYVSSEKLKLL
jgi:hypothetical protein